MESSSGLITIVVMTLYVSLATKYSVLLRNSMTVSCKELMRPLVCVGIMDWTSAVAQMWARARIPNIISVKNFTVS